MVQAVDVYNASLESRIEAGPYLLYLRVRPDNPGFHFSPGQFAILGLRGSSARNPLAASEENPPDPDRLIRRAYSIASSNRTPEILEFYLVLVPDGALSPRLFALEPGERLYVGAKASGTFTLDRVPESRDLILISTGTGIAPFMSMVRSLHRCDLERRFILLHGARHGEDLGYREELELLAQRCGTLIYLPTLTRAGPEEGWGGHVGRVQTLLDDGTLRTAMGRDPDPARDHVFLCGNPQMLEEMQPRFESAGFALDHPRKPGTLHLERYW